MLVVLVFVVGSGKCLCACSSPFYASPFIPLFDVSPAPPSTTSNLCILVQLSAAPPLCFLAYLVPSGGVIAIHNSFSFG